MKNKILALTILAFTSMNAMAQEEVNVTGKVVDKVGNRYRELPCLYWGNHLLWYRQTLWEILQFQYQRMLSFGFRRRMMQKSSKGGNG